MTTVSSTLDIIVKADTSGAKALASALQNAERQAKEVDAALSRSGTTDKFQARLKAIGASATHIEAVAARWKDLAKAETLAEKAGDWTKAQSAAVKNWENVTVASIRAVMGQERAREIAAVHTAERAEAAAKREGEARTRAAEAEEHAAKRAADVAEAAAKRQAEAVEAAARREVEARVRAAEMEERAAKRQADMEVRLQHRMDEQRAHAMKAQGFGHYVLGGAAMAVSAHGVMTGVEHTVMAGANYQRELVGLQNAGRTPEEIAKIQKASEETVKALPTSTYTDNLKTVKETVQAFGSVDHAVEHLQFMQKTMSVLEAAGGEHIEGGSKGVGQNLAKYFEERMRPAEEFETESTALVPAMVASGGLFNPSNLLMFAQQAKSALPGYSLEFMRKYAPTLIASSKGGDRAGTAASAFDSVITGKARDKKQAAEWMRLGLLDPKEVIEGKGGPIGWKAGAVKGTALAATNPVDWAEQVLIPAMKAKHIDTEDRLAVKNELATLFRNGMSNYFANEITQAQSLQRLHKDAGLYDQVGSEDDIYKRNLTADPTVAVTALKNSLENLMTTVSGPAMTAAAGGLTSVAEALNKLAGAAKDHPMLAMAAGATTAGGALAGSGYLSYQLMNGFGLGGAATELTASAAALDAAAVKLGGGSLVSDAAKVAGGAAGTAVTVGAVAAAAAPVIATAGVAALMEYDTNPSKALVSGGTPDLKLDPSDWLPGLSNTDNATPFRGRPAFPHTPTPRHVFTREDDPYLGGGRQAIDEQARRSAADFRRDPEAARGRAMMSMPQVDTTGLDQAKQKADEAHAALDGLNTSVTPQISLASLDAFIAKANEARAAMAGLSGAAAAAGGPTRVSSRSFHPAPAGNRYSV